MKGRVFFPGGVPVNVLPPAEERKQRSGERERKRDKERLHLCASSARRRKKKESAYSREKDAGRFHGKRHFSSEIPEGLLTRRARHNGRTTVPRRYREE